MTKRRSSSPRFVPWILTGAVLGFAVAGFLAVTGPEIPSYRHSTGVTFTGLFGAFLGAILFAVIAVLLDMWGTRRRS